jgi:phosphoribosylamine-glycine ligase
MKKLFLSGLLLCFILSFAFAQETTVTLKGDIIDNLCAGSKSPEELTAFVKAHSKECATAPDCAASGYAIFADGKLYKFNKESNAKIEEFLRKADSKLQAVVEAKMAGEELSLVSVKNQ